MKSINKKFAYLLFLLWKVCTALVWMELPEKSFFLNLQIQPKCKIFKY